MSRTTTTTNDNSNSLSNNSNSNGDNNNLDGDDNDDNEGWDRESERRGQGSRCVCISSPRYVFFTTFFYTKLMFFTVNINTIYCDKRTGENRGNEGRGSRRVCVSSPWYFLFSITLSILDPLDPPSSESLYPQLAHLPNLLQIIEAYHSRTTDAVTHIVVDEVHERDIDTDLLLVVLKQLHVMPSLSTTLQSFPYTYYIQPSLSLNNKRFSSLPL
jgi:hypothetical protein